MGWQDDQVVDMSLDNPMWRQSAPQAPVQQSAPQQPRPAEPPPKTQDYIINGKMYSFPADWDDQTKADWVNANVPPPQSTKESPALGQTEPAPRPEVAAEPAIPQGYENAPVAEAPPAEPRSKWLQKAAKGDGDVPKAMRKALDKRGAAPVAEQATPQTSEPPDVQEARKVIAQFQESSGDGNMDPWMEMAQPNPNTFRMGELRDAEAVISEYEKTGVSPLEKKTTMQAKEFDKQWATLKPGQSLRGPDGQIYVKRSK